VFIAGVNVVVISLLLVVCHSWLGCRVDRLIEQAEHHAGEQQSRISDFAETMTDIPSVPGEYP